MATDLRLRAENEALAHELSTRSAREVQLELQLRRLQSQMAELESPAPSPAPRAPSPSRRSKRLDSKSTQQREALASVLQARANYERARDEVLSLKRRLERQEQQTLLGDEDVAAEMASSSELEEQVHSLARALEFEKTQRLRLEKALLSAQKRRDRPHKRHKRREKRHKSHKRKQHRTRSHKYSRKTKALRMEELADSSPSSPSSSDPGASSSTSAGGTTTTSASASVSPVPRPAPVRDHLDLDKPLEDDDEREDRALAEIEAVIEATSPRPPQDAESTPKRKPSRSHRSRVEEASPTGDARWSSHLWQRRVDEQRALIQDLEERVAEQNRQLFDEREAHKATRLELQLAKDEVAHMKKHQTATMRELEELQIGVERAAKLNLDWRTRCEDAEQRAEDLAEWEERGKQAEAERNEWAERCGVAEGDVDRLRTAALDMRRQVQELKEYVQILKERGVEHPPVRAEVTPAASPAKHRSEHRDHVHLRGKLRFRHQKKTKKSGKAKPRPHPAAGCSDVEELRAALLNTAAERDELAILVDRLQRELSEAHRRELERQGNSSVLEAQVAELQEELLEAQDQLSSRRVDAVGVQELVDSLQAKTEDLVRLRRAEQGQQRRYRERCDELEARLDRALRELAWTKRQLQQYQG